MESQLLYGFAQFNIIPLSDDEGYSFQTNGMLMSKLATNIGETDEWHTTSVRCQNEDTFWDHLGASNDRAEVRSFNIDNVNTSILGELDLNVNFISTDLISYNLS